MKKFLISASVAVLGALSTQAGVTAGLDDLVLGFKSSTATNNLMVNLGSSSQFAMGGTQPVSWSKDVSSLLTTAYGSDWNTITSLNWGVAGTQGAQDPEKTAFVTSQWGTAAGTLGVQNSVQWTSVNSSGMGSAATNIGKVYSGLTGASAANTLSSDAVNILASNGSSWSSATTTGGAFVIFNPQTRFQNQVTRLADGTMFSASDLYQMDFGVAGQFQGTFALDQSGILTFTAVPEPSTYAMILGALTLGVVAVRRRFVKQA